MIVLLSKECYNNWDYLDTLEEMTMAAAPKPTKQQAVWQDRELGMFMHFGMNTFCDQEWGEGKDSPERFDPADLDARQWARVCKRAGFSYGVLTAKHHDGFCLWPTKTTPYSVASSPFRGGKGDVVREAADAFAAEGLGFGLYLSPWDRNAPCYPDAAAYNEFYLAQLSELLRGYGPLCEVWFDGAGSAGRSYDWTRIMAAVHKYQKNAVVFNMGRPTIRWVGNEDGLAPYPCWNVVRREADKREGLLPDAPAWCPAECDVPIRGKHWFWHPDDEGSLRSLPDLLDIYHRSVGHGAGLLLNVAPDSRGLIPSCDEARLCELGDAIAALYGAPLARGEAQGPTMTLHLPAVAAVDRAVLMEGLGSGERVRRFRILCVRGEERRLVYEGTAIGHKHIARFRPTLCDSVILHVDLADDTPLIRSFAAFAKV